MEPLEPLLWIIGLAFVPGWLLAWALVTRFGPRSRTVQPGEPLRQPPRPVAGAVLGLGVVFVVAGIWLGLAVDAPGSGLGGAFILAGGLATAVFSQAGRLAPAAATANAGRAPR